MVVQSWIGISARGFSAEGHILKGGEAKIEHRAQRVRKAADLSLPGLAGQLSIGHTNISKFESGLQVLNSR